MEEKSGPIEVLLERAQAFTKTSIKLFKLKATDRLSELLSNLAASITILAIFALCFVNLNIGIALLVGELLGKAWLGFILIAALYAFIGLIAYLFRDKLIKRPVSNSVINQLLKEEPVDNEDMPD